MCSEPKLVNGGRHMGDIKRIFVEKKEAFAVEAKGLLADLRDNLRLGGLKNVRILARYDVMGLSDREFAEARKLVLSEPPVDTVTEELVTAPDEQAFAIELLPGQYDQREDFAEQCIQLISQNKKPVVAAAKVFVLKGALTDAEFAAVKKYTPDADCVFEYANGTFADAAGLADHLADVMGRIGRTDR